MAALPFLLEIGVEEVPDWMIEPALASMRELFSKILAEHKLGGQVTWVDATPRRLVLRADNILESQADESRTVSGPPTSSGAGAATGFAKKLGVTVDQLDKVQTAKGEYFSFVEQVKGRRSIDILSETLPKLIASIPFPKTMYWAGKSGPRFIRPIRWMLSLLGDQHVPFTFGPVSSGTTTIGHRIIGPGAAEVTIDNYEETLRSRGVILRAEERKAKIESELRSRRAPRPGAAQYPCLLDRAPNCHPGRVRSRISRASERNTLDGHAPSPALLYGLRTPQPARSAVRRYHQHRVRS